MTQNQSGARGIRASGLRVVIAFAIPLLTAVLVWTLLTTLNSGAAATDQAASAVILGSTAVAALALGWRWYGSSGMGLRGGRPLSAGIGFAVLGWVAFLVLRFIFVAILIIGSPSGTRAYLYLLLFEALATQLWTFGLLFRAISDWRGPLTAAIAGGVVFGLVAQLYFQEAFITSGLSLIYFGAWGILYGLIRLRTGSLIGIVLVQSVHTFTSWVVLQPYPSPNVGELNNMYLTATVAYMIIIWRLWPKDPSDYRV